MPEEEQIEEEEENNDLVFPNAVIVRELKKAVDKDKMIKKEVKEAANKFLEEILADIGKRMNDFPYAMIDYRMFEEATRPYRQVKELDAERERVKSHLDTIIQDCQSIKRDLDAKLS